MFKRKYWCADFGELSRAVHTLHFIDWSIPADASEIMVRIVGKGNNFLVARGP